MLKADLHIHTIASDGSQTPESVVEKAKGLKMIAITDHDAIKAVNAAQTAGEAVGLPVISGIEFSVAHKNELHILGYFMDTENPELKAYTAKTQIAREKRIYEYLERLKKQDVVLEMDTIRSIAGSGMLSRVHLAQGLVDAGYVSSIEEAFKQYLGRDADTYIEKEKISKKACMELILACGGISVWAHPVYQMDDGFDDLLDDLLLLGLNGLEAYHPDHNDKVAEKLDRVAQKKGMLVTKGSDYHGKVKPEIDIGSEKRSSAYLEYCLELLYKKATQGKKK